MSVCGMLPEQSLASDQQGQALEGEAFGALIALQVRILTADQEVVHTFVVQTLPGLRVETLYLQEVGKLVHGFLVCFLVLFDGHDVGPFVVLFQVYGSALAFPARQLTSTGASIETYPCTVLTVIPASNSEQG